MKIIKGTQRAEVNRTVRQLMEMLEDDGINDGINLNPKYQRGYVWKDNTKKSGLIRTLIIDRAIPPLYFNQIEDVWDMIDGKQRLTTIRKFLNDEFSLSGLDEIQVVNNDGETEEIDINGLTYSELPEEFQNAIKEYSFTISLVYNASQDEVSDIFYNLNNGQSMNAATMNRLKAKSKDIIIELGEHEIFKESLSKTAMNGHVNEDLAVKAHAILYAEEPSMDAKFIRPYTRNTEISEEEKETLIKVFDRIKEVHDLIEDIKVARKIYRKTHFVSVVPIIKKSIDDGLNSLETMEWFVSFFTSGQKATISSVYNTAAGAGSGKAPAVAKRVEEIEKSYNKFMSNRKE